MKNKRIDTSGTANPLANNPFAALDLDRGGLNPGPAANSVAQAGAPDAGARDRKARTRDRGRVDVIRQTAGRGGKTVTVLSGFKGIATRELEELARAMRKASGVGGTLKGAVIEIQGDQREKAESVLREAGFRPVRSGG